jgi:hypothetical protein
MLDRQVVQEFLESQMEDIDLTIPADIDQELLVEAFCQYIEDDYYEWLKDNFKSFFNHGDVDWEWVREQVRSRDA